MRITPSILDPKVLEQKIAAWMNANPPAGGQPPTNSQIRAVVDAYFTQFPPAAGPQGPKGDPGKDGADGQSITGPAGPAGRDGADGVSIKGDAGASGVDGRHIELGRAADLIRWRYVGDSGWNSLANVSELMPSQAQVQSAVDASLLVNPPARGPEGATGSQGPKGDKGDIGPIGPSGPKGDVGATGPQGPIGLTGAAGANGDAGAVGAKGDIGPTGPSAKVALPNIVISETAAAVINAGPRVITINGVTGALPGDGFIATPVSDPGLGYLIHNIWSVANNQVKVSLTAPLLAIGASYSITMRLIAVR